MYLILIILLCLLLVGAFPAWPYAAGWGLGPFGVILIILLVLVVLSLRGRGPKL